MSARDSSALAYVSALRHGRKRMLDCRCEKCEAIKHVLRLATAHVSVGRLANDRRLYDKHTRVLARHRA